jgi:hypothetical protein
MKITMDMAPVDACDATECAFNKSEECHAGAITVGDGVTPNCDTFYMHRQHPRHGPADSGVGPCKVSACRHNRGLSCQAANVRVGWGADAVRCLTYSK